HDFLLSRSLKANKTTSGMRSATFSPLVLKQGYRDVRRRASPTGNLGRRGNEKWDENPVLLTGRASSSGGPKRRFRRATASGAPWAKLASFCPASRVPIHSRRVPGERPWPVKFQPPRFSAPLTARPSDDPFV